MISTNFFHAIEGRIRVHVPELKGAGAAAREVSAKLMQCDGIVYASANPATGNVLINYDARRISYGDVFQSLWGLGYLRKGKLEPINDQANRPVSSKLGETVTRFALEALFLSLAG
jgi:hypothetical protein